MAFALGAGFGLSTLLAGSRRSPRARAALVVAVIGATALALAWLASQVSPAWSNRYFSVFIGPLLLLGAAGLARGGRLGLVVVAILFAFWFNPRTAALEPRATPTPPPYWCATASSAATWSSPSIPSRAR